MALSAGALASEIRTVINAIDIDNGEITNDSVIDALAQAIVDHIKANGKANVTGGSSSGQWPII